MNRYIHIDPGLDAYWRSIILFGRNVASYKFALGKTLLELAARGETDPKLEDLAPPFAEHLCAHLHGIGLETSVALRQCNIRTLADLTLVNLAMTPTAVPEQQLALLLEAAEVAGVEQRER